MTQKLKVKGVMKKAIMLIVVATIVTLYGLFSLTAQTITTTEAKVVVVVNSGNNAIKTMELFTEQHTEEDSLLEKYPDCNFYIGLMEGSYEVVRTKVRPQSGTTLVIFNNRPLFKDTDMVFMEHYSSGDHVTIGETMARVISNNKGELFLLTQ